MPDFTISADSVDVEQIMRQIRARIREKRGVDYTEEQIRELAAAKLERFLDPTGVRSELLEQFRKRPTLPPGFLYEFEDTTLFDSDKAVVRFFRRLLRPVLKLFFNPNVLSNTLHTQAAFNQYVYAHQPLQFELLHNLVLELTRAGIELKNLKMRLESVQSRLEFNERRARALEAVVQYKPDTGRGRGEEHGERRQPRPESPRTPSGQSRAPQQPAGSARADAAGEAASPGTEPQGGIDPITGGESLRTRRRRRRRGRRGTWDTSSAGLHTASAGVPASADGVPADAQEVGPDEEVRPGSDATHDAGASGTRDRTSAGRPAAAPAPSDSSSGESHTEVRPDEEARLKPDHPYEPTPHAAPDNPPAAPDDQHGPDDESR